MAFNRDNRSGGGRDFGRRKFGGDRGPDRQMFKTTCSNCGRECEVPFKPTGSKPVYCSDCFRTMGGPDSRRTDNRGSRTPNFDNRSDNRGQGSAQPQYREQFEALNAKLDKILKLLNPEKSAEAPKVVAEPQVEDVTMDAENVLPVKKKTRSKKPTPAKDTVETQAVIEVPTETDLPTKTSTE